MSRVAVVGAGTMGSGIAHMFAQHGWDTTLIDVAPGLLERVIAVIRANFERQVKKGTVTALQRDAALARIRTSMSLDAVSDAELVVEAATEQPEVKFRIFRDLDRLAPPAAILASNTSSISITALAGQTKRAPQVIGMHFITGTGVMKCIPITWGARLVWPARAVIEMDDVLLARIAAAGASRSRSRKILNFTSGCSVAASTTSSASDTASRLMEVRIRASAASRCEAVTVPFFTCRSKLARM